MAVDLEKACEAILNGEVVVFPTETVYGLGADATNSQAVAKIFALKNRPTFNPLIIHYPDLETAKEGAIFNDKALELAKMFWPGPLTLVLPRQVSSNISLLSSAGLDTIGVRVPNNPVALSFLKQVGRPIAAPSANLSGSLSPTSLEHVKKSSQLSSCRMLEGGKCQIGLESTIVDLSGEVAVLLRPGGITEEKLTKYLGSMAHHITTKRPNSPGQLLSHYAPNIPVRLQATYARTTEAFLGFGKYECKGAAKILNLSLRGDLVEAAANLFEMLHELDQDCFEGIAVAPIPEKGLGVAINDRLRRAAAERPVR